ncbi:hypothetical protein GDO78_022811 [Eleutherodactylus coqui]|uniref:Uncharacterized protein n=1 Tax=Eleutherodactylus coqui TaxID=57060 RepID=A0A8J6EG86_ELECQ|nr:hypothetical protein GDO78_022811 [Eleutherodactylus coqui]
MQAIWLLDKCASLTQSLLCSLLNVTHCLKTRNHAVPGAVREGRQYLLHLGYENIKPEQNSKFVINVKFPPTLLDRWDVKAGT